MTDKRSSPVKAIIGADKVVGLMTEDGLNVPGFDGTGYVTDEELEERLEPASLSDLKAGISTKKPIVPLHQHQSVFYALAKAAGVNLASSTEEAAPDGTNPGVYPASAIQAILKMLFPTPPSANGAYPLCCVVSNGTQVFGYISTAIIGTAVVGSSTVA